MRSAHPPGTNNFARRPKFLTVSSNSSPSLTNIAGLLTEAIRWVNGKGGGSFVDAANRANFLGAKLIVSVNAYTDTPQSAGQMAAFAKANHIPVAVWELAAVH
jgi:hypothetical protein